MWLPGRAFAGCRWRGKKANLWLSPPRSFSRFLPILGLIKLVLRFWLWCRLPSYTTFLTLWLWDVLAQVTLLCFQLSFAAATAYSTCRYLPHYTVQLATYLGILWDSPDLLLKSFHFVWCLNSVKLFKNQNFAFFWWFFKTQHAGQCFWAKDGFNFSPRLHAFFHRACLLWFLTSVALQISWNKS